MKPGQKNIISFVTDHPALFADRLSHQDSEGAVGWLNELGWRLLGAKLNDKMAKPEVTGRFKVVLNKVLQKEPKTRKTRYNTLYAHLNQEQLGVREMVETKPKPSAPVVKSEGATLKERLLNLLPTLTAAKIDEYRKGASKGGAGAGHFFKDHPGVFGGLEKGNVDKRRRFIESLLSVGPWQATTKSFRNVQSSQST